MSVTPYQLRRSEELMDSEIKERTGWADTSDRAERMRAAADRIEELEAANAALMSERTSLITTKREQLANMRVRLDLAERLIADLAGHDGAEGFSASTYALLEEWDRK